MCQIKEMIKLVLSASVMLAVACTWLDQKLNPDYGYVKITNNSEHNITSVVVIDLGKEKVILNEKDNELISPNGNSKSFKVKEKDLYERGGIDVIACLEAEDTSELMCSTRLKLICGVNCNKRTTLIWNGSNDPAWQTQQQ